MPILRKFMIICDPAMTAIKIDAPAKINLHLRVKDRRPDGYHDLESIFLALAFGDTLHFELLDRDEALELLMESRFPGAAAAAEAVQPEKNIVFKAISLFRARTGFNKGLRVRIEKRIPLGGGLGGGSSDAASALLALNTLGGGLLESGALGELAASLGSDVPFFLGESGAAWVSGRGEEIFPLKAPENLYIALITPEFSSGTAEAFGLLDKSRGQGSGLERSKLRFGEGGPSFRGREELIGALSGPPGSWAYENDFLPVFLANLGEKGETYRKILGQLGDLGADFAGLSGAGSTCFGVFSRQEMAEKAENFLLKDWRCIKVTFPLARKAIAVLE
jgi:4-diphosphocytidyl-2-C-methyl-D-erythritol kinase